MRHELRGIPLQAAGTFPSWLAGALLRTGPAQFEAGEREYNHWFDGLAMLHRFAIADGKVTYTNRFLESPAYLAAKNDGTMAYSEFATDPCRTLFKRVATLFTPPRFGLNANVSIEKSGNDFLALTETPLPVVFDPVTLDRLGVAQPAPGQISIAHPHRSPRTGEHVSYATRFGARSRYQVFTRTGTSSRVIARLPAPLPSYMHSFAVTEHYAVLVEYPFVVFPAAIPLSGRPFIANYRWRPDRGTRFRVVELATGRGTGTFRAESFFAFHHVNAFELGSDIVLDVCAYDNADIVGALYLDRLRAPGARLPRARLRRYRLLPGDRQARSEPLPDVALELPRIDYDRCNGRRYRYLYGVGTSKNGDFPDLIVKTDVEDGAPAEWSEAGCYPGEPVFVRRPDAVTEDGGVLLSVVLDSTAGTSFLLALDAVTFDEIARAQVPHHIPFGFHGGFFPGT